MAGNMYYMHYHLVMLDIRVILLLIELMSVLDFECILNILYCILSSILSLSMHVVAKLWDAILSPVDGSRVSKTLFWKVHCGSRAKNGCGLSLRYSNYSPAYYCYFFT